VTETLAGTVALVTGASSGIGAATARALADHGAAVAMLARRADRLDQLNADIESTGGTALSVPTDVTDADQVATAVQRTVEELGRLDTVVNNAGLMRMSPAAEAPLQDWDDLVRVNIQGVLYVTRAAIPHLIDAAADSPRGPRPPPARRGCALAARRRRSGHHQLDRRLGRPTGYRCVFADQVRR
jgi:NADP-dependent 3-hydroxy acid dehydrogenase YdfG